jgi:hypothetical protein
MGENLYSLGLTSPILDYWKDPETQLKFFNLFVQSRSINFTLEQVIGDKAARDKFSTRYNGSIQYGERLLFIYNQLKDTKP